MKNLWIRFGCFLTGYNYGILMSCSEASKKTLKKYTSAMLIVMILWGFIGFLFAGRYLKTELVGSVMAAIVAVVVIVQIERQIILQVGVNKSARNLRVLIALIMAILGSLITDQIIFKDDVDISKQRYIQDRVDSILPKRATEIDAQLKELSTALIDKETERYALIQEITLNPLINIPSVSTKRIVINDTTETNERVVTNQSQPNPKAELLPSIDEQIKDYRSRIAEKEERKINLRMETEKELKEKVGFLDELTILFGILFSSGIALFVWGLLFFFFGLIELFVLFTKQGGDTNDYDETVKHQMDINIKKIENLSRR